jgi:hypothetical protein
MFVRFRLQGYRLQASLMQSRRAAGKVRNEHIGALGSVDADVSVRERVTLWAKVHDRLAALGNRLAADEHPKILGALHSRIPMPTPEDIRAVQEESFAADERFWDGMRDMNASHIEGLRGHIALAEAKLAAMEPEVAKAAEKVEVARSKREKLKRGESVTGGLGKPFGYDDVIAILKAAGFTPRDFRRLEKAGSLTEAEREMWFKHIPAQIEAEDRPPTASLVASSGR